MGNSSSASSSSSSSATSPSAPISLVSPQNHLYASSCQEYDETVVVRLIREYRLAPFYLGVNEYDPGMSLEKRIALLEEADQQATSNLEEALAAAEAATQDLIDSSSSTPGSSKSRAISASERHRDRLGELLKARRNRDVTLMESHKVALAKLYKDAIECPICFLYYPAPLVHTRCCDQPICTECFVQIKRADPDVTHLESEPACCPFCMCPNFGCVYTRIKDDIPGRPNGTASSSTGPTPPPKPKLKTRRRSFAHTEKQVVTTDQLHPNWEAKVAAMRATVARRENRRIVFRQVGDRLIPVGITSGRTVGDGSNATMSTASLPPGFASQIAAAMDQSAATGSSRDLRRAARRRNEELAQLLSGLGMGASVSAELEEMMMNEAMRLSMVDDEERRRKQAETEATMVPEDSTGSSSTALLLSEAIDAPLSRQKSSSAATRPVAASALATASTSNVDQTTDQLLNLDLSAPASSSPAS